MVQAKIGDNLSFHCTARLVDGTMFDSSLGNDPLPVDLGSGNVMAGLEEAVLGMSVGDSKTETIPADLEPEVGMHLQLHSKDGQPLDVRVIEVSKEHVRIDAIPH